MSKGRLRSDIAFYLVLIYTVCQIIFVERKELTSLKDSYFGINMNLVWKHGETKMTKAFNNSRRILV